ncbi:DNA-processing protein DprA [Cohnella lubricantis]|uniref:DNA-protecting protein DprA n=1 Tax=Cohnella lubricantis TaxID=2163172 RepID=A0A841TKF7_9BACL|nr:DNA-processing protein DprA [Cohnella lubricantis]MBB6679427.1 DNA-protecting protein DprA [Cohnella lubricantis]MBP2117509.1 DNA processing protein [Cohnella lubricantis]
MNEALNLTEAMIAMHETEGIGWKTIDRIVKGGGVEGAQQRREADWKEFGLYPKQAAKLTARLRPEAVEAARRRRERAGLEAVTALEPEYPHLLTKIADPPWVLYYIGSLELANRPTVAIVGTRMATSYGRRVAEDLAAECARGGLTIVSGLAKGIDTAAHIGALKGPGSTIAVLATPADTPYPYENRALYRDIAGRGLILSETPQGTPLHPGQFPLRNRIIAGLSLGTVVVEAAERSGAMITVDKAIEMNRDVFVVPGPITSPRSKGPLALLRTGAKPVMGLQDIVKEYPYIFRQGWQPSQAPFAAVDPMENLSPSEKKVYALLIEEPKTIDELTDAGALEIGELHASLLSLRVKRMVEQRPGSVYAII